ncbi:MAG: ureidoglycolate lyase [Afipia sp.]
MLSVKARIVDPVAFAPFGELIASPNSLPNIDFSGALENQRDAAKTTLYTTIVEPVALPLMLEKMERHRFSSQTFLPLDASRYLVCVAPHDKDGKPDAALMQAFIVPAGVGITYRANVWHHPMTALDRKASFAVVMWRDGSAGDEEFVDLTEPLQIEM